MPFFYFVRGVIEALMNQEFKRYGFWIERAILKCKLSSIYTYIFMHIYWIWHENTEFATGKGRLKKGNVLSWEQSPRGSVSCKYIIIGCLLVDNRSKGLILTAPKEESKLAFFQLNNHSLNWHFSFFVSRPVFDICIGARLIQIHTA